MFKTLAFGLALSSFTTFTDVISTPALAATTNSEACTVIGGVGMPNFVPQEDGTITIVAPLTGSVSNASGKVTAQRETATGLEMDMEHYFMTEDGGFMHTKDLGILTSVVGKQGQYMIEITYDVQEASTSGSLKGYKGSFSSYGLVDLPKLQGLIRYSGAVCK
ncbi:hypothetical protein [Kiloniella sp.]|uniref:hypothetical protein n=1 Tax=Kiloniella sp. TaxID=1938587 RepID=UPI003B01EAD6